MTVHVNGEPRELSEPTTVAEVVQQLVDNARGVAVALDGDVVARSAWGTTPLRDGQKLEILRAVQGG